MGLASLSMITPPPMRHGPDNRLSLFLQQVGRALRPAPGKEWAWVFDHAGNSLRHGHPESDRAWTLESEQPAKRSMTQTEDGQALTVRQCLSRYAIHPSAPVCPFCGTTHPVDDRIPKWRAAELRELDRATLEAAEEAKRKAAKKAQGAARRFRSGAGHEQSIRKRKAHRP